MPNSIKDMMAAANACVSRISPEEAKRLISDEGALLVDVRDPQELSASGKLDGALNVSRGMLEFRADPSSAYHNPEFSLDRAIILYCASGGRSILSAKALQDLGFAKVYNLGSFKDAAEAGFPTETAA